MGTSEGRPATRQRAQRQDEPGGASRLLKAFGPPTPAANGAATVEPASILSNSGPQTSSPFLGSEPVDNEVSARPPAGLRRELTRIASETRVLALALARFSPPEFSKKDLGRRWQVGPDSVREILRTHDVDPGPGKGLLVPLILALLCEQVSDPLALWVRSSTEECAILQADLLTFDEWRARQDPKTLRHDVSLYRHLKAGRSPSIRIGKLYRFRPDLTAALRWLASRQEVTS